MSVSYGAASENLIKVAAAIIRDQRGWILTDRKHGTTGFMSPGGKREPGETYRHAVVRECWEELHERLDATSLRLLGVFTAPAANEPGFMCEQTLFEYTEPLASTPVASAEIDELRWVDPNAPFTEDLAPLFTQFVPRIAQRRSIRTVTCYMGASSGNSSAFATATREFAHEFALRGIDLVYGGGKVGLMGVLADEALATGGEVHGVIPSVLADAELAHPDITRLDVTADMSARKERLGTLGDAIVALPGGAGTMEEFWQSWTWQHLGIHNKPVALYNVNGYWDPIIYAIESFAKTGFLKRSYVDTLIVTDDPDDLIEKITTWTPPARTW